MIDSAKETLIHVTASLMVTFLADPFFLSLLNAILILMAISVRPGWLQSVFYISFGQHHHHGTFYNKNKLKIKNKLKKTNKKQKVPLKKL